MAEVFKFQKNKKVYFNVDIDGEIVSLPIGATMPVGLYDKLAEITKLSQAFKTETDMVIKFEINTKIFNELIELFALVIPAEQMEKLGMREWSVEDLSSLFNAWQMTAIKAQGISLGESQASASS